MDWFEKLMGFKEATGTAGYEATRARLEVVDDCQLRSRANGRSFGIGKLELISLQELRRRSKGGAQVAGRRRVRIVQGDVGDMHERPEYRGALFQVASQFNLLEMVGPEITPEHGVTRYDVDKTQGPACAIAAGAATIYRNYFAPVGDAVGQTRDRQLDGFAELGGAIARGMGQAAFGLWEMRNGYAMFSREGLASMSGHVASLKEDTRDELRQRLRIGVHSDVEVTRASPLPGPFVSQAFCSALPVSYHRGEDMCGSVWHPLAALVLEAAYEATLWAAVVNAQRGSSRTVLLTLLGGGAFGNDESWILAAMQRAITTTGTHGLDVVVVTRGTPSPALTQWLTEMS